MVQTLESISTIYNKELIDGFENAKEIIKNIRDIYQKYNINWKTDSNALSIGNNNKIAKFTPILNKLTNVFIIQKESSIVTDIIFIVQNQKYSLSLGRDFAILELDRMKNELKYKQGFLESIKKKLSNEKFLHKAPLNIIEIERKKLLDAEQTISSLKESISKLEQML